MNFRIVLCFVMLLSLWGCSRQNDIEHGRADISARFQLAISDPEELDPVKLLSVDPGLDFVPLDYPQNVSVFSRDSWLKSTIYESDQKTNGDILEIPGHLFDQVDIWFQLADGQLIHDNAGVGYPYVSRKVKHAGVAFNLPPPGAYPVEVLIRIRSGMAMPVNFAAILWESEPWGGYLFNQRGWYGLFFGAILILSIYNIFLAFSFKDKSYLYYVGYMLMVTFSALLVSGLAEEYLWPEGKTRSYLMVATGFGIFFAIKFVNTFLQVKSRRPLWFQLSNSLSTLAMIFGVMLMFSIRVPLISESMTTSLMHALVLVCGSYFIAVSLGSYFAGVKQARFLSLSMFALLGGMTIYFFYTYGVLKYGRYVIHVMELGTLVEGVLLSFALSDRINVLSQEKKRVEHEAMLAQQTFSRRLIQAQEKERETFSNTMHDSIGHGLLVLKQNLDSILSAQQGRRDDAESKAIPSLQNQVEFCSEILHDVRGISHDLHPHLLERLGLKSAIESTMERALSTGDYEWQADIGDIPAGIDKNLEITIYRVIQESLNNILKHSDASEVMLSLHCDSDAIEVNIKDDGKGFDIEELASAGLGLHEMKDRLELFGGHFTVNSSKGLGTHISFRVPLV